MLSEGVNLAVHELPRSSILSSLWQFCFIFCWVMMHYFRSTTGLRLAVAGYSDRWWWSVHSVKKGDIIPKKVSHNRAVNKSPTKRPFHFALPNNFSRMPNKFWIWHHFFHCGLCPKLFLVLIWLSFTYTPIDGTGSPYQKQRHL